MLELEQLLEDRYRLQQPLGINASRQTWLAEDQTAQTQVVVKLLAFSPQLEWADVRLFEREAEVLQQLTHPKIPRYLDYFSVDKKVGGGLGWFGLVQDYIPGTSLYELLKQGQRFTVDQVRDIAAQVLEILAYLHSLKPAVLHRDIKPSNLILDPSGQIYLVDFGAVQNQAAREGATFTVVGTAGYAPLEQFWGRAVPASDLYALGATLIHLLTGVAPADLPQHNLRIQFADRVSLDPSFVHWVEALTAPDLEQRYQTAASAITDLLTGRALSYPLKAVRSPVGNRVKLWRSPQQLKIEVQGSQDWLFLPIDLPIFAIKLMLATGSTLAMTALLISMVSMIGYGIVLLAGIPFLGVATLIGFVVLAFFLLVLFNCLKSIGKEMTGVQADLGQSLPPFFRRGGNVFSADRNRFTLEWKLFGIPIRRWRGSLHSLRRVESGKRGTISIQTWVKHYGLGYRLNASERRWLVQEIQDWLDQRM